MEGERQNEWIKSMAYLFSNKRRVISKPCILSLCLAMNKARIYEESFLIIPCKTFDIIKHFHPEICFIEQEKRKKISLGVPTLYAWDMERWKENEQITLEKLDLC